MGKEDADDRTSSGADGIYEAGARRYDGRPCEVGGGCGTGKLDKRGMTDEEEEENVAGKRGAGSGANNSIFDADDDDEEEEKVSGNGGGRKNDTLPEPRFVGDGAGEKNAEGDCPPPPALGLPNGTDEDEDEEDCRWVGDDDEEEESMDFLARSARCISR